MNDDDIRYTLQEVPMYLLLGVAWLIVGVTAPFHYVRQAWRRLSQRGDDE